MADEPLSKEVIDKYHASQGAEAPAVEDAGVAKAETAPEAEKKDDTASAASKVEIPSFTDKKEVATESKETTKPEKKTKKDDDPHADNHRKALKEARDEARALKKQMEEESQKRAALEAKFNELFAKPAPKKEDDPVAFFDNETKALKEELTELRNWRKGIQEREQTATQIQQFKSAIASASAPFIEKTKDYKEAYDYVIEKKRAEFSYAGVPDAELAHHMGAWEGNFAANALKSEKSPAEGLYGLAQALGYKPKSPISDAEKKIATIQEGQSASKTVSGGGNDGELSFATLEQMTDEQINAIAKDPKKWNKLMGVAH